MSDRRRPHDRLDLPSEGSRESIPLLLARTTKAPPPDGGARPPADIPRPTKRLAALGSPSARSKFGTVGIFVATLFVLIALIADFLASELPIACKIHERLWLFPNVTHPAELTAMGPEAIAQEASWSVRALVAHGPTRTNPAPEARLQPPLALPGHPLGTDRLGRDVFARCVHGTRGYLLFALCAVFVSLLLGGFAGGCAGLFGGATDAFVGRVIETVSAFPSLVLILGIQAAVPRATLATLFFAIALTRWPEVARLVRAEVMQVATRDYVMAARALGASPLRVLSKHVMPNVRSQIAVLGGFGVPAVMLIEASLDFLRVGSGEGSEGTASSAMSPIPATAASWGETMSEFRDAPHAWWLLAFPGALLFIVVIAMNLASEARREALDPRAR